MLSYLAYRDPPCAVISLVKGRAPTLSRHLSESFLFCLTARTLSPKAGTNRKRLQSLSPNMIDFVQGRYSSTGVQPLMAYENTGGSRMYEQKKCPEYLLGRLPSPLERTALSYLARAKVRRNPETCKKFRDFFHFWTEKVPILRFQAPNRHQFDCHQSLSSP